jgi:thiol-disulfide isomerase/thioredoxin
MSGRALLFGALIAVAIAAPCAAFAQEKPMPQKMSLTQLPIEGEFPSLGGAAAWLNSPPLTPAGLRGKVVLVDFWTYSCINWRRSEPYVRAWAQKYKDRGLVVIGVHAPEFAFEHDVTNVRWAAANMRIDYPIAIDNDFKIWNAFDNEYWPALYFIDAQGRIRHHQFGEGDYVRSEEVIQQLLTEAGAAGIGRDVVSADFSGYEAPADWPDQASDENYLGYERSNNFSSPGGAAKDTSHAYSLPERFGLNDWALSGEWIVGKQAVLLSKAGGRIAYHFHARDLHLIAGPATAGRPVRFRVLLDGRAPGAAHGLDVDERGYGTVTEPRLYQLIRQPKPIVDRQFEIEFLDPGVAAYDFTFG